MKLLLVHNYYQQRGGEDVVFENEKSLLCEAGHTVVTYTRSNEEVARYGWVQRASLAPRTIWAWDSIRQLRATLATERPDIAHFHNTFPLISPAAYLACKEAGVPVIQTLHNPRLLCPAATLYRDGHLCEDCVGKMFPWGAILHGCYRESRLQTGVVTAMLTAHRVMNTWESLIDRYIASTHFFARKFVSAGLRMETISVKPHFAWRDVQEKESDRTYALFVGRLAPEKGISTLLDAWKRTPSIPLKIRGDGPLLSRVQEQARDPRSGIQWVPRLSDGELSALFRGARFLVWPSLGYYETFGLVAVEAFARRVPVIASHSGAAIEVVRDGCTGLHFRSGAPEELATKVEWAWTHPNEMGTMGRAAAADYEAKYAPERNYELLMNIYRSVIGSHKFVGSARGFMSQPAVTR